MVYITLLSLSWVHQAWRLTMWQGGIIIIQLSNMFHQSDPAGLRNSREHRETARKKGN
jgi:hypothetical protein